MYAQHLIITLIGGTELCSRSSRISSDLPSVKPFKESSLSELPSRSSTISSDLTSVIPLKESSLIGTSELLSRWPTISSDLTSVIPFKDSSLIGTSELFWLSRGFYWWRKQDGLQLLNKEFYCHFWPNIKMTFCPTLAFIINLLVMYLPFGSWLLVIMNGSLIRNRFIITL